MFLKKVLNVSLLLIPLLLHISVTLPEGILNFTKHICSWQVNQL